MKISIKTKLALIFLLIACSIGVSTSLIVNSLITNRIIFEAQERGKEHLNRAHYIYASKVRDIDRTVHRTSVRHVLKRGLQEKWRSSIQEELSGLMAEEGLDFLTLVDRDGKVLHRLHHPQVSGDSDERENHPSVFSLLPVGNVDRPHRLLSLSWKILRK